MYSNLEEVIENISKYPDVYNAVFEYRPHYAMFGTKNYGEIISKYEKQQMINPADNDPWDVFAPGYNFKLKYNKRYKIKEILGIFLLNNGNHKIAIRVNVPGFDEKRALAEIKLYCKTYMSKVRKNCEWLAFHGKYFY